MSSPQVHRPFNSFAFLSLCFLGCSREFSREIERLGDMTGCPRQCAQSRLQARSHCLGSRLSPRRSISRENSAGAAEEAPGE